MKKLWIFNHYAVTPYDMGGTRHFDLAKELAKQEFEVTIFASKFIHFGFVEKEKDYEIIDGVEFVWLKTFHYNRNNWRRVINMITYFFQLLKQHRKYPKPDVIIASSPHLLTYIAGLIISKLLRLPLCIEIRDLWPQTMVDMGILSKSNLVTKFLYKIESYVYSKCDKIITLLPGFQNYLQGRGIKTNKITWIPNGINFAYQDNLASSSINHSVIEQINSIKLNTKNIMGLYMGAMGPANYLDNIIFAAKILKEKKVNVKIVLIGEGSEKERLKQLIVGLALDNIFILNKVPKNVVYKLYDYIDFNIFNLKRIDILKYGLSSNKLFDYMYSSRPTIFACQALNNPVEDSCSGISIPPEEPEELAQAIESIVKMTEETRKIMGQKGRQYAILNHDIRNNAKKLKRLLEDISLTT